MKNIPTKILIRHIPPKMTEEKFKDMITPIPDYDYFRFHCPDTTLGPQAFCRAYINFTDPQSVFNFRERFSDYVFVDEEGNEANAVVEYAVFQGVPGPASKQRVDKRQGTLDDDPEYKTFLASILPPVLPVADQTTAAATATSIIVVKDSDKKQTPWEAMLETIKNRNEASNSQTTVTPLVAHMNQRLERRKRHTVDELLKSESGGGSKKSGFQRASGRLQPGSSRGPVTNSATRKASPKHTISDLSGKQTVRQTGEKSTARMMRRSRRGRLAAAAQGGNSNQSTLADDQPQLATSPTAAESQAVVDVGSRSQRVSGTSGNKPRSGRGNEDDVRENHQQEVVEPSPGYISSEMSRRARFTSSRGRRGAGGLVSRYPQTATPPVGEQQQQQPPSYSSRHAAAQKQQTPTDADDSGPMTTGAPRGGSGNMVRGYRRGKSFSSSTASLKGGVSRGGYR